ncbi:MAG TPA: hypothetical protein VK745_19680 [Polyangiaceae bacterium]|nr:hypothetical protein [Polyangiaceae bacterium]
MGRIRRDQRLAALAVGVAVCCAAATASAADGAADRHPSYLLSPSHKPAGVPADYVLTHNGFFHPSCVVTVGSDEVVGADLVIRGRDGSEHARVAPCAYPRYDRHGVPVTSTSSAEPPPVHAAPVLYDGYILYYAYNGAVPVGPTLTTDWTVPLAPKTVTDQDIAFFNDIVTTAGGGDILQPVLDFNGEVRNHWAVESEHCCIANNDMQTTPVDVNAGDQIRGTVVGSNCSADGVCQNWAVTTTDVTTGGTTTLNTTAPTGVPNGVSPCALETYGVTSCDMFPASGEAVFVNNQLTSAAGTTELKYRLLVLDGVNAEVPRTCGYTGMTSGDDYTLIFGALSTGGTGGASGGQAGMGAVAAGAGGRSSGGASGMSAGGSGGASNAAGANNAGGASSGGAAGSSNAGGQTGTGSGGAAAGGTFNGGGGGGAAGAEIGIGAGAAGFASTSAGQANTGSATDSTGCSCKFDASGTAPSAPLASLLAALVTGLALARRRRERP